MTPPKPPSERYKIFSISLPPDVAPIATALQAERQLSPKVAEFLRGLKDA